MKGSFFQRHLVQEAFATARSWPEQVKLQEGGKPANAEYEQWTLQLEYDAQSKANGVPSGMNGIVNGST